MGKDLPKIIGIVIRKSGILVSSFLYLNHITEMDDGRSVDHYRSWRDYSKGHSNDEIKIN